MEQTIKALEYLIQQRLILIQPQFLSPELCEQWIEAANQSPASAAEADSYGVRKGLQRKTTQLHISPELNKVILSKLETMSLAFEKHFQVKLTRCEQLQFLKYAPGDYFKPHIDKIDQPIYRERQVSIILLLNEPTPQSKPPFTGGRLSFFVGHPQDRKKMIGIPVLPATGMLIAFRPNLLHEVSEVTSGHRYSIVTWLAT